MTSPIIAPIVVQSSHPRPTIDRMRSLSLDSGERANSFKALKENRENTREEGEEGEGTLLFSARCFKLKNSKYLPLSLIVKTETIERGFKEERRRIEEKMEKMVSTIKHKLKPKRKKENSSLDADDSNAAAAALSPVDSISIMSSTSSTSAPQTDLDPSPASTTTTTTTTTTTNLDNLRGSPLSDTAVVDPPTPPSSPKSLWSPRIVTLHRRNNGSLQFSYSSPPNNIRKGSHFTVDLTSSHGHVSLTPYDHSTLPPCVYTCVLFYEDKKLGAGKVRLCFSRKEDLLTFKELVEGVAKEEWGEEVTDDNDGEDERVEGDGGGRKQQSPARGRKGRMSIVLSDANQGNRDKLTFVFWLLVFTVAGMMRWEVTVLAWSMYLLELGPLLNDEVEREEERREDDKLTKDENVEDIAEVTLQPSSLRRESSYPLVGNGASWTPGTPSSFNVRTHGYLKNGKIKRPPTFELYTCVGVEHVRSEKRINDIGGKITFPWFEGVPREARGVEGAKLFLPSYFVVNMQMSSAKPSVFHPTSDSVGYNLAFVFRLSSDAPCSVEGERGGHCEGGRRRGGG